MDNILYLLATVMYIMMVLDDKAHTLIIKFALGTAFLMMGLNLEALTLNL